MLHPSDVTWFDYPGRQNMKLIIIL